MVRMCLRKIGNIAWLVIFSLALTACGGGGGSSSSGGSPKPTEVPVVPGQPGPGDPQNFFPFAQGNTWTFDGTDELAGFPPESFTNLITLTGTTQADGQTVSVFNESNTFNEGAEDILLLKDNNGIISYGNLTVDDQLTPQLVPNWMVRFPLEAGSTYQQLLRTGLDFDDDVDGDLINETADVESTVTVVGFETVNDVPTGPFDGCAKVETKNTITVIQSTDGLRVPINLTLTIWYAPGVGWVKRVSVLTSDTPDGSFQLTTTEVLSGFTVTN